MNTYTTTTQLNSDVQDLACACEMLTDTGNLFDVLVDNELDLSQVQSLARLAQFNTENAQDFIISSLPSVQGSVTEVAKHTPQLQTACQIIKDISQLLNLISRNQDLQPSMVPTLAKLAKNHSVLGVTCLNDSIGQIEHWLTTAKDKHPQQGGK